MDLFPLHLFPTGSLSSSVITTVWVGLMIVCFFNVRFGWGLSGLVVPGYMTPLLLVKPWSAAIVFLEGFTTYLLVWLFSERLSRAGGWHSFFGRDRFFALVLVSIVVRLIFDGWLLPELGEWLNQRWQINFDYRNHLHSFGLIIVALVANQFWKTGFIRGLIPFSVTILVTVLIVRFMLMELTNFSLSGVSYLYEDMASSILASPKAYIILVSTAFLASRMNLHYGWDFNGILIPSLLALQWYQPIKILTTVLESGAILLLASLMLKTPWLRDKTIEGANKLLLFFNVGFVYKILLAFAIPVWFPEIKITDSYGFGYLLSTLIAVKIHEKEILARLLRATVQTSLTSVLFASVIGFALTRLPFSDEFQVKPKSDTSAIGTDVVPELDQNLSALLQAERVLLYQAILREEFEPPLYDEIDRFSKALKSVKIYLASHDPIQLQTAASLLAGVNYQMNIVNDRYLYLHEAANRKGWGMYIIDTQANSNLAVEIPAPFDEENVFEAGIALFTNQDAKYLAIAGSGGKRATGQLANVLDTNQTFFYIFHRVLGNNDALQIRSYSDETARLITGIRRDEHEIDLQGLDSILWVKNQLPDSLNSLKLKDLMDSYRVSWAEPPFASIQREASLSGFAELMLSQTDIRKILSKSLPLRQSITRLEQDLRIDGYLQDWILSNKKLIAEKGSNRYQVPKIEELLFIDEQVLTPLFKLIDRFPNIEKWSTADYEDLKIINQSASAIGYQIIHYRERHTGENYLILSEIDDLPHRYWGIYVLRLSNPKAYLVQVPRPVFEVNTFEYGVALFERLDARAIAISTTDPHANLDNSSNLVSEANKQSMLNLFHQVLLREQQHDDLLVINSRAFSYKVDAPLPAADVLFSTSLGLAEPKQFSDLEQQLFGVLEMDGMEVQLVNGSDETLGYEQNFSIQARYLNATENKRFVTLWLSPFARAHFKQQSVNVWQSAQFEALNIPTENQEFSQYLQDLALQNVTRPVSDDLKAEIKAYAENQNVVKLQQLIEMARASDFNISRLIDSNSRQSFLLIKNSAGQLMAAANIGTANDREYRLDFQKPINSQLIAFVEQRAFWLNLGSGAE